jgi:hypothetical protein
MTDSTLVELKAEGAAFKAEHGTVTPGDDFFEKVAKVLNGACDKLPRDGGAWTPEQVAPEFGVMHGYLHIPYIHGFTDDGDPWWADDRQSAWHRWLSYLVAVDGWEAVDACEFAREFFYAVDEVAPYS